MAQTDFWSPVLRAIVVRQQGIEQKQANEARQKRLELEEKRIEQFEKQNERLLKQMEAAQKINRLDYGLKVKEFTDKQREELTGTSESPASRSIPGADLVQQQPLLENILQQKGLVNELPRQPITVRGQENAPVNLDIPDPFTGESQVKVPIGRTQELIRERSANEATRRAEEQRKLQLTGQLEGLKARAKAEGEFPAKVLLERVKNENAIALETDKQKNRETLANIKGGFQITAARERKSNSPDDINSFAALAQEVGLGLQAPPGASKDKRAVTNILHENGWVTPPKDLSASIDALNQAPILLGQVDSLIEKLGDSAYPAIKQAGRALINPIFPQEIIKQRESLSAFVAPIMRNMFGEKGNLANRDIERGEELLTDLSAYETDNVRRRQLLDTLFETSINNKLRALPETQKRAIFEQYSIPYRVLTPAQIDKQYAEIDKFIESGKKSAESTPSANASGKPVVSANGKIVTYNGRKYAVGEPFTYSGKKLRWLVENGEAIPEEVQ